MSIFSFELDAFIPGIHASYGYIMGLDFSAYGEAVVIFVQNVVLVTIIHWYGNLAKIRSATIFTLFATGGAMVASGDLRQLFWPEPDGHQILVHFRFLVADCVLLRVHRCSREEAMGLVFCRKCVKGPDRSPVRTEPGFLFCFAVYSNPEELQRWRHWRIEFHIELSLGSWLRSSSVDISPRGCRDDVYPWVLSR